MGGKRWALSVPVEGVSLAEHAEVAREAERLGYTDAWSLEVDGVDCFTPLAVVAPATRLRVGTAIANVYNARPGDARLVGRRPRRPRAGPLLPRHRRRLPADRRGLERRRLRTARDARARDGAVPPPGARRRARRLPRGDVQRGRLSPDQAAGRARPHPRRGAPPGHAPRR